MHTSQNKLVHFEYLFIRGSSKQHVAVFNISSDITCRHIKRLRHPVSVVNTATTVGLRVHFHLYKLKACHGHAGVEKVMGQNIGPLGEKSATVLAFVVVIRGTSIGIGMGMGIDSHRVKANRLQYIQSVAVIT